ncbi:MAG: S-adenosylmethionine decarboxylase [Candidatus Bathyarchaeota archaeon]|nr:S-adenosylmethionine decarboxylase [Candidatus Bathyarchaeota archaeon]
MIGLHLLVDGVMTRQIGKADLEAILNELPGRIGMHILAGPLIVEGVPENPGWTGFVIIDKSHISVHSFNDGNRISVDLFSCKMFDTNMILEYLENHVKMTRVSSRVVERCEAS